MPGAARRTMWGNDAGVEPEGNALLEAGGLAGWRVQRARTLGRLGVLPDRVVCAIVAYLAPDDLASLSAASRGCRAFALDEDVWRAAVFAAAPCACFAFTHSWRATYAALRVAARAPPPPHAAPPHAGAPRRAPPAPGSCASGGAAFYSDVLFLKYRCLHAPVRDAWLSVESAARAHAGALSVADFRARFEAAGVPVVLSGLVGAWPAAAGWGPAQLAARFGDVEFSADGFDVPLADYLRYARAVAGADDQAMTLFDPAFAEKAPALAADYAVPPYFAQDLFAVLGDQRPHFRWLIAGPPRSGSRWHKDPNGTAAWNAVLRGRKKWILFPPGAPPPGVVPSDDGADVSSPVSIMEWFLTYYADGRVTEYGRKVGAVECVVSAGEIMFIPAGWWHCVLNVDFTVAVTQNYVSTTNVAEVGRWLRDRPEQISGCKTEEQKAFVRDNFVRLVAEKYPSLEAHLRSHGLLPVLSEGDREHKRARVDAVDTTEGPLGEISVGEVRNLCEGQKRVAGNGAVTPSNAKRLSTSPVGTNGHEVKKKRSGLWDNLKRSSGEGGVVPAGEREKEGFRFDFGSEKSEDEALGTEA